MTKLLRASALVLTLSVCALADDGIMQTGAPAPPPPSATSTDSSDDTAQASDGIMQTSLVETVEQVSLSVMQSLALI